MCIIPSLFMITFALLASDGKKRSIIILNNAKRIENKKSLPKSFIENEYLIKENYYYLKEGTLFKIKPKSSIELEPVTKEEFKEALGNTKLLYLNQYSNLSVIFKKPWFFEQIITFLNKGGCIFFDYLSLQNEFQDFFKKVNLGFPSDFKPGYYNVTISEKYRNDPLFTEPNKISCKVKAYGSWNTNIPKAEILLCDFAAPERAALILYKNVSGKGLIICNQYPGLFRKPSPLTENMLSFIYEVNLKKEKERLEEESGGPGEDV